MAQIELLAPAGDMEKLETALDFGADAVYVGGAEFGLRAQAGNFDLEALRRAGALCRERGRRLYLTLNAFLRQEELPRLQDFLEELRPLELDAYIVSDPGVLALVRTIDPEREIHLSTQANTTNAAAVAFWRQAGVRRVNLARELSLEEIRQLAAATDVELEVFVHGAMCVAWSGRCLISSALTGRSANRGNCAQPCRWSWTLQETTRPGEHFTLEEDARGSYLFNSRDLRLLEHLPQLLACGVKSLKIEGRMKSRYYVAAVTRVYRAAIDAWRREPENWRCDPLWLEELDKVSHRPYDSGFLFPRPDAATETVSSRYLRSCDFVGVVLQVDDAGGLVEGRNRFLAGETLELIGPAMRTSAFRVEAMTAADGRPLTAAHAGYRVRMALPAGARPGDLLRRPAAGG
ncbi:putative protease [Geothermobacter ehrlichii]|uniref:Putative protease n=1 Tax=Geothermobacter ehrlichii TaxID=213224 RepID=A0A5D3WJ39_9BACT|nr:U32 family peptidase [Geothermobacter ehrlichii]TYO98943.1 putative protease [Geothermobacter ehrlichii]